MKILEVIPNNRKKSFEVKIKKGLFEIPYARLRLKPTLLDKIVEVFVDKELASKGFTYKLQSGKEDSVLIDQVLEYNRDSDYLHQALLYKLSLEAQTLLEKSKLTKRAIIRRMGTSPTHFYRLLDQTNTHKTVDEMIKLLNALDYEVAIKLKKVA
ncbi:MAG: hypothetical protein HQM15_06895 [Deltaproteobacteria bacterium]|nr:hypothetical protein [Deltaproteobacteria bacterium]